ncbi:TonB-dependent receptor [Phenylobacterium sp.]|uniref:TonB-dependent receptor n=1 Tax=Phenylobacterium sp. TaxID=1871053 RepID=UPI0025FC340B|nr:TonB-dependent receptor [Phenylobacterium sp.]MBX3483287.1 TonB-dependent receptor [Phenylobacterium sp.]MCW5758473.1 TonB-dependent receptor [Phenylobacterium sp.]
MSATAAFAQSGANEIEELVVTAEKREQSLQDVPVAVSAFTDERREMVGINSVQDLTNFTPGLAYSTNNDRASLRGIGRFSNNRSVEGGVAMYNDGFYTSSVTAFAQSTLFLERTEVLRGPQGTLYGKNAIGGALNIVSKRPTDDFYAEARGLYGNYDSKALEAAVSGPLFGNVRGRLAASWGNIGKGVFKNLNPNGEDEGNRGTVWTGEFQLDGNFGDGKLEWWLKHSTTEWHTLGRGPGGRTTATYGFGVTDVPLQAPLTPNAARFGQASNALPGNTCQFCFDTDDGNYINLESHTTTLNVTFHADTFDVKYITGQTYYDYRLQTDLDGTSRQAPFLLPLPAVPAGAVPRPAQNLIYFPRQHNQYQEEVWWFSNELNIASTTDGPVQWLLGVYQYREGSNYRLSDARFPDDARFERPVTQTGTAAAPNPLRRYAVGESENKNESYAAFGQVDWQINDQFKVTGGLRYTKDEKTSFEGARLFCLYQSAVCPISRLLIAPVDVTDVAAPGFSTVNGVQVTDKAVVGGVGGIYTDPTTGLRHRLLNYDWSAMTGTFGVDWKPDPDTLLYGKYSRGYKAGGFDSGTTTLQTFVTTEKEIIDAYELGLKKTFGGRLQTNVSAFYYDYQDIQIPLSFFNETVGANQTRFVNVPKAENYGLEIETIWQPIDGLQILANYSYLNARIKEGVFTPDPDDPLALLPGAKVAPASAQAANACIPGRSPTGTGAAACSLLVNVNQDISGAKLPSSTPHRFTVNANYTWDLASGRLSASGTYVWRAATYYSVFNTYANRAKSYGTTDFRMLYNDKDDRFTVIGSIKNVFDQRGSAGVSAGRISNNAVGNNVNHPLFNRVNETVSYILPRTYSLEVQYRFR